MEGRRWRQGQGRGRRRRRRGGRKMITLRWAGCLSPDSKSPATGNNKSEGRLRFVHKSRQTTLFAKDSGWMAPSSHWTADGSDLKTSKKLWRISQWKKGILGGVEESRSREGLRDAHVAGDGEGESCGLGRTTQTNCALCHLISAVPLSTRYGVLPTLHYTPPSHHTTTTTPFLSLSGFSPLVSHMSCAAIPCPPSSPSLIPPLSPHSPPPPSPALIGHPASRRRGSPEITCRPATLPARNG
ncbi:hypothetical protein BO70DRAFT_103714 [Aspergillus heteromorphus CBS 117.55]|uniref:Uncharacterized protein n=1 Tax=Aspergillus heteromorphus CBS 117.55 TaxID=1448321 RepID=A0A317VLG7_9EURO|nr:uncharacterized protein BO70DRAFT_103714 [Aspergillus heteromorphus CBS 117.55]PWY75186.1 hypothetical protein BO70DRAFT_103714 [Aspergillus heteromorphus CBS 117.55]